ncbi:MAG: FeoB-associated Cys-rich membrane protein [Planctomycetota bacterium]
MNQIDWQVVATLFFVAAAVYFLIRRIVRFCKQRPGCAGGSCTGCPAGAAKTPNFVSLDQLKNPR